MLFSTQLSAAPAEQFFSIKNFSEIWLLISHPAETIAHYRHDLSSPFELQYSSYAHDDKLQIMSSWTRSNRNIASEWRGDNFHDEHSNVLLSLLTFGNAGSQRNLNTAYRLGVYGQSYVIFTHKRDTDSSSLLLTHLDAPSVLLYGFSWVVNAPQRWFKQAVFVVDSEDAPWYYLLDWLIAVPLFLLDLLFASIVTILGFALAFLLHPINSLCSFGGLLYFVSLSVWSAGYELLAAGYYLLPDMWILSIKS
jgi:hypothetical protein